MKFGKPSLALFVDSQSVFLNDLESCCIAAAKLKLVCLFDTVEIVHEKRVIEIPQECDCVCKR